MEKNHVQDDEKEQVSIDGASQKQPVPSSSWPHNLRTDYRTNHLLPKNSKLRWILLIPFILVLSILAALYKHDESRAAIKEDRREMRKGDAVNNNEGRKRKIRNNIRAYVKAASNDYQHSKLGGIADLKITIDNTTDYTLDRVRVKIVYIKANGGIWETRFEDFYKIKRNSTVTHEIPDTKRGTRIVYEIASIKSKALGLN